MGGWCGDGNWRCDGPQAGFHWWADGRMEQQILSDYPQLESDDFRAVYAYAAELAAHKTSEQ